MFAFHERSYVPGVRDYDFDPRYPVDSVLDCMELCCSETSFRCQSFSYWRQNRICNLIKFEATSAKSIKSDIQQSANYDFYARVPFFNETENAIFNDGKCYQKRLAAFRWRWENPRLPMSAGPYVPICDDEGAKFVAKQCDTRKYTQAAFQNQWSDSPDFSCFCVDQEGNKLELTESGPSEANNLDCTNGEFFNSYFQWRKQHFDEWLPSFDLYLKKKQIPVDLSTRVCPNSVPLAACKNKERVCFDDYFGCRFCHCNIPNSALIDGTCDVPLELRESCEQKIGSGEITSVSRCASAECCFETGSFSQRVDCFKKRAAISDESLVLNWDADRVYVSYLYNHWLNTVQLFTAEANSTGPPLFPGVKHMFF
ncbi:unnamed protein product [Oikopleura dioica]|uniref:Apple domain-containing protein n=1 Tax=Oikopleura dioica TaxID=34765 RepID=E4X175_OIKDI|nr:unnamed protein product [Oikopleura dioica]